MSALKRAILDTGKYPPTCFGHHAAAWYLLRLLAPNDKCSPAQPVKAWLLASGGICSVPCTDKKGGGLNQRLGFQPTASDIGTLFVRGFPGSFKATADMTPQAVTRLVLKAYVCGHLPALEASLAALPTAVGQRFRQLRESLLAFLRCLPDAAITATPSLPDEISSVTATLAREVEPDEHRRLDKCRGFTLPVKHPVMRGKWAIDPAFDRAWEQGMALTVHPAEQETRLWVQKVLRAWHHAWYCVAGTPTPASRLRNYPRWYRTIRWVCWPSPACSTPRVWLKR